MRSYKKITLGIPARALKNQTVELFRCAGFNLEIDERLYKARIDDPEIECFLSRSKEIASHIGRGVLDAGITSEDAVIEAKADTQEICKLNYSQHGWTRTKVVLAVPEKSRIRLVRDLRGKKIITRLPQITRNFLRKKKVAAEVIFNEESNEPRVPMFAEALVEFTTTGITLKAYKLRVLETIRTSGAVLAANREAMKNPWKKKKIDGLTLLLKGARLAQDMVGLTFHASNDTLGKIWDFLPALKKPTITQLRGENCFDVFTVVNKKELRTLIPKLKDYDCTDLVEFPLSKVIL